MNIKILDKKINKAYGYQIFLSMGFFVLVLGIALIALQMAGKLSGSQDEEIIFLITIGAIIFSALSIGISLFLITKKKNYAKILQVSEQSVAEIIEDINNLELNTNTFALGQKYAYFYGKLISKQRKFFCIKYEEIERAKFRKWRNNEQILFYDKNAEWIATVGGYKRKSQMIKNILTKSEVLCK